MWLFLIYEVINLFVLESENEIELRVEKYETFYQIYNPYHVS